MNDINPPAPFFDRKQWDHEDDDNVEGPLSEGKDLPQAEEARMTYSEHYRVIEQLHNEQRDRQFALTQATATRKQSDGPKQVVETAQQYLSFLSGDATTVEESPESISSRAVHDSYVTGAEDRQRLVLKRVRELLSEEWKKHDPNERVTVTQAYDRVGHILDNAKWEF